MKAVKLIMGGIVAIWVPSSFASNSTLALHGSCSAESSECVEFLFLHDPEQKVLAKKKPDLIITEHEIAAAKMIKNDYGQEELALSFEKSAAENFARVTGNNVGKQLVIVANGKALIAPQIHQPITGGSLVITSGSNEGAQYLDGLPWIKKMVAEQKANREKRELFSIISFLVLGNLVVGGSIYFAFFGRATGAQTTRAQAARG